MIHQLFKLCFGSLFLFLCSASGWSIERKYVETLAGRATGILPWELRELSGLAHCRTTPDRLWAINDSGGNAILYALSLDANLQQSYHLFRDSNKDWEDLSCGRCADDSGECLYIGDIGSNQSRRKKIRVFMIPLPLQFEETPKGKSIYRKKFSLRYPDGRYNAETLLVHPQKPVVLIVTKEKRNPANPINPRFYTADLSQFQSSPKKIPLQFSGILPLSEYLTKQDPPASAWITSGDFYPDGQWFVLMSYMYFFRLQWPVSTESPQSILLPIWGNVNRAQLESFAFHQNGKQFWIGSEINRSREPLLLMELPLQR
ncbi:MAG: hypothetical protein HQM14_13380 [SAR324 cluster bacterium]|nr:hypothetical protein [SAR324 cluster bacterium]